MADKDEITTKIAALLSELQMKKDTLEQAEVSQVEISMGIQKGGLGLGGDLNKDLSRVDTGGMSDAEMLELVRKYLKQIELKVSDLTEKQQEDSGDSDEDTKIKQWTDWLNELENLEVSIERRMRAYTEYEGLR